MKYLLAVLLTVAFVFILGISIQTICYNNCITNSDYSDSELCDCSIKYNRPNHCY